MRPDDVWSARGRASLSTPYSPARGFGEGDGTSPWAWNVLYNVIVKFATMKRRANAQHRGLCCGSPGDGSQKCNLIPTGLVRMTKDRANTPRSKPRSLLMTPPCTEKQELHESDHLGLSGMDCFAQAVSQWGSHEHEGKRERHAYGQETDVCLVGLGMFFVA